MNKTKDDTKYNIVKADVVEQNISPLENKNDEKCNNFLESKFTDVKLVIKNPSSLLNSVEEKTLFTSKWFLSLHSEFFKAMFEQKDFIESKEGAIILDKKYETVERLLLMLLPDKKYDEFKILFDSISRFTKQNGSQATEAEVIDILVLAKEWQIEFVANKCVKYLEIYPTSLDMIYVLYQYDYKELLQKKIDDFITTVGHNFDIELLSKHKELMMLIISRYNSKMNSYIDSIAEIDLNVNLVELPEQDSEDEDTEHYMNKLKKIKLTDLRDAVKSAQEDLPKYNKKRKMI